MGNIDYKDKIRKLLKLSESPNEHEARAAMLKARQLMAEHKLTEAELKDVGSQKVIHVMTGIEYSKRYNPWIVTLSTAIGPNYCCQQYSQRQYGRQIREIGFVGFEDDVELCVEIFKYAVDCALSGANEIKMRLHEYGQNIWKPRMDSYGFGFAVGLQEAFEKQQRDNEQGWGLVMVMPEEVKAETADFKMESYRSKATERIDTNAYMHGLKDGRNFNTSRRLSEA